LTTDHTGAGILAVSLGGDWKLTGGIPSPSALLDEIASTPDLKMLRLTVKDLGAWDSGLLAFLMKVTMACKARNIEPQLIDAPEGVERILALATAVPEQSEARKGGVRSSRLARIGEGALRFRDEAVEMLTFVGEVSVAFARFFRGKARFRRADFWLTLQECGAAALPIVSLISLLVGLILAFVGSIQLKIFGLQIFIAALVGIAMARAMGAIMTGIIMSGRTGAAFAARIGTMQVNEEIDALKTAGFSPVEFLVLPRVLALALMMPLLTLYSDLMGMLGGLIVGVFGFDISVLQYYTETKGAITLTTVGIGVFSGLVFGILVALAGCLRGMQCGRSASAVGDATTSAVVTGIVSIIVATAVITVVCDVLGI
jgi:phospholipid/cholesterol/gamma-HCH transport system permease protein